MKVVSLKRTPSTDALVCQNSIHLENALGTRFMTIGESWQYKVSSTEDAAIEADFVQGFSRNVYSFWQPLDQHWLEIFNKVAHYKGLSFWTPYWSTYFFVYLDYDDPDVTALREAKDYNGLSNLAGQLSAGPVKDYVNGTGSLTATGQTYCDIIAK